MAQENVATLTEFEQFMAREIVLALDSAGLLLRLLDGRLPKDDFLRLARPLFSGLKTLTEEVARQNLALRVSLWAPGTHKPGSILTPAPGFQSFEEEDEFCFETELASLRDSLSVVAPLFE